MEQGHDGGQEEKTGRRTPEGTAQEQTRQQTRKHKQWRPASKNGEEEAEHLTRKRDFNGPATCLVATYLNPPPRTRRPEWEVGYSGKGPDAHHEASFAALPMPRLPSVHLGIWRVPTQELCRCDESFHPLPTPSRKTARAAASPSLTQHF